jgi:hypothetical protein
MAGMSRGRAVIIVALAASVGGWMLFDGLHVLLAGAYAGSTQLGPWAALVTFVGLDPYRIGPLFVLLGVLWLIFALACVAGAGWGKPGATATAIASLWYIPLGTLLSLTYLAALLAPSRSHAPTDITAGIQDPS